jgi:hypothetical protein
MKTRLLTSLLLASIYANAEVKTVAESAEAIEIRRQPATSKLDAFSPFPHRSQPIQQAPQVLDSRPVKPLDSAAPAGSVLGRATPRCRAFRRRPLLMWGKKPD